MDNKRLILAIVLSMGILFLYPYIVNYINPPKPAPVAQKAPEGQRPGAPAPEAKAAPQAAPLKEELITVETPRVKAVITTIGGGIKGWELKKYSQSIGKSAPAVNLTASIAIANSYRTQVAGADGVAEDIEFQPSAPSLTVPENGTAEVLLAGSTKGGIRVEKKYTFTDSYLVNTEIRVFNSSALPFNGRVDTVISSNSAGKDKTGYHTGPVVNTRKKLIRQSEKEARETGSSEIRWMGLEDKYFLSAILPKAEAPVSWVTETAGTGSSRATIQMPASLAPGARAVYAYGIYLGPKEYDLLLKYKTGLEESIEFGYFGFMAKPFLVVLNFFQRYLVNYGLAIVILTGIIKVLFYPLTKHSLNSMKEMQKIQPQLAAIKEKYKDNKEKLNKEMMELYKRYKINPVGGCLPMILQIPVFIALYEVLYVAIELRHAPLFLWIRDLSDKDPYYITPVIMGVTMFIQQKMSPSTPDPQQAKIMLIMPVVFTFMFLNFPSGLVLYWLVNNVLSIAQQYYIQKAPAKAKA